MIFPRYHSEELTQGGVALMCELLIAAFSWVRAHLSFKMLEIYLGGFEEPRTNACPTTLRQREQH